MVRRRERHTALALREGEVGAGAAVEPVVGHIANEEIAVDSVRSASEIEVVVTVLVNLGEVTSM